MACYKKPTKQKFRPYYSRYSKRVTKIRTVKSKRGRRIGHRKILNFLAKNSNSKIYDFAVSYLENNQKIPELDEFVKLKKGDLIRSKELVRGQTTKPAKRSLYLDYQYLKKIMRNVPEKTIFMFLERHEKFPEYYKFFPIGYSPVWINIADYLLSFNMYKKKNYSKNQKKVVY